MIARSRLLLRGILTAAVFDGSLTAAQPPLCTVTAGVTPLAGVGEASGVAVSRRTPGILWSHNDSGPASLFAFDTAGNAKGRVELTGVTVDDWEDLAIGQCPEGSCLYVADIGSSIFTFQLARSSIVNRPPCSRVPRTISCAMSPL